MGVAEVERIVDRYGGKRSSLIGILHEIQTRYNYLPEEALRQVADRLDMKFPQVYGVATFFKAFSLKPRGRHTICVCLGTACHVRGGQRIVDELARELGIRAGETTEDLSFTLETVNCLGACALGPVVAVDGSYYGHMTSAKVKTLLKGLRERDHAKKS
jgi:NADH-quinone oxidoreductase subunit E